MAACQHNYCTVRSKGKVGRIIVGGCSTFHLVITPRHFLFISLGVCIALHFLQRGGTNYCNEDIR